MTAKRGLAIGVSFLLLWRDGLVEMGAARPRHTRRSGHGRLLQCVATFVETEPDTRRRLSRMTFTSPSKSHTSQP